MVKHGMEVVKKSYSASESPTGTVTLDMIMNFVYTCILSLKVSIAMIYACSENPFLIVVNPFSFHIMRTCHFCISDTSHHHGSAIVFVIKADPMAMARYTW